MTASHGQPCTRDGRRGTQADQPGSQKILDISENATKKFKFVSFAERVALININPLYRSDFVEEVTADCDSDVARQFLVVSGGDITELGVKSATEVAPGTGAHDETSFERLIYNELKSTYFATALRYWQRRMIVQEFHNCAKQLSPLCLSLPSVILHLKPIVKHLLALIETSMNNPSSMMKTIEPAYHLLAVLAKDVREEFRSVLPDVLSRLIEALEPNSTDSLEFTFYTVAALFRHLSPIILKDMRKYLSLYLPWLVHPSAHVRLFAAESLSFLLRRLPLDALPSVLENVLCQLELSQMDFAENLNRSNVISRKFRSTPPVFGLASPKKRKSEDDVSQLSDSPLPESVQANGASQQQTPKVLDQKLLAETLGALLFEVVKNVQNSFNSKLQATANVIFRRVVQTAQQCSKSNLLENEDISAKDGTDIMPVRANKAFELSAVTARIFILCLRGHVNTFDSRPAQLVTDILSAFMRESVANVTDLVQQNNSGDSSEGAANRSKPVTLSPTADDTTSHCSEEQFPPNVLVLCFALQMCQEWVALSPRPWGSPTTFLQFTLEQTTNVLNLVLNSPLVQNKSFKSSSSLFLFSNCVQLVSNFLVSDTVVTLLFLLKDTTLRESSPSASPNILDSIISKLISSSTDVGMVQFYVLPLTSSLIDAASASSEYGGRIVQVVCEMLQQIITCPVKKDEPIRLAIPTTSTQSASYSSASNTIPAAISLMSQRYTFTQIRLFAIILMNKIFSDIQPSLKTCLRDFLSQSEVLQGQVIDYCRVVSERIVSCGVNRCRLYMQRSSDSAITQGQEIRACQSPSDFISPRSADDPSELLPYLDCFFHLLEIGAITSQKFLKCSFLFVNEQLSKLIFLLRSSMACIQNNFLRDNVLSADLVASEVRAVTAYLAILRSFVKISSSLLARAKLGAVPAKPTIPNLMDECLSIWGTLLHSCRPPRHAILAYSSDVVQTIMSECPIWDSILASMLNDMVKRDGTESLSMNSTKLKDLFESCLHLLGQPDRATRLSVIRLLLQLSSNRQLSIMTFPYPHNHEVKDDFRITSEQEMELVDNMLRAAEELESLENSFENEKLKLRLIGKVAEIVVRAGVALGTTNLSLFGAQLILSQISEKFMPLWKSSTEAMTEILAKVTESSWNPAADTSLKRPVETDKQALSAAPLDFKKHPRTDDSLISEESDRKKRRQMNSASILTPFHLWVFRNMRDALKMTLYDLAMDAQLCEDHGFSKPKPSEIYVRKKKRGAAEARMRGLRPIDPSTQDDSSVKTTPDVFWKFWNESITQQCTSIMSIKISQTDPVTRHQHYCRVMAELLKMFAPHTNRILGARVADDVNMNNSISCVGWILRWCLANAMVLCEKEVPEFSWDNERNPVASRTGLGTSINPIDADHEYGQIRDTLVKIRHGRGSRVIDCFRMVVELGRIGTSLHQQSVVRSGKPVSLELIWADLVETALHRVMLIPDRILQDSSLKVALMSSTIAKSLNPYKEVIAKMIGEADLAGHLLLLNQCTADTTASSIIGDQPAEDCVTGTVKIPPIFGPDSDCIAALLIRMLFSKLSKKSTSGTGANINMVSRRRAIFRFFASLPPIQLPTLFVVLFRPCLRVEQKRQDDQNGEWQYEPVWSEARKEAVMVEFFKSFMNRNGEGAVTKNWDITVDPDMFEGGHNTSVVYRAEWVFEHSSIQYRLTIPILSIARNPNILGAILNSAAEVVVQMRQVIDDYIPFLGQFFSSVIAQFSTVGGGLTAEGEGEDDVEDYSAILQQEEDDQPACGDSNEHALAVSGDVMRERPHPLQYVRLHRLARSAILLLSQVITRYPALSEEWNVCITKFRPVFTVVLSRSLEGAAESGSLKFICALSQSSEHFAILGNGLGDIFPKLFEIFCSCRVMSDITHGRRSSSAIDAVLSFVLRLCRGGYSDLNHATKEWREQQRGALTMKSARKSKWKNRRTEADSDDDNSCTNDLYANVDIAEMSSYAEWKTEVEKECEAGRALLRPHLKVLLANMHKMLSHRKNHLGLSKIPLPASQQKKSINRKKKKIRDGLVSLKELEVLTELTQLSDKSDYIVAGQLVDVLMYSLPSPNVPTAKTDSASARMRLAFSSLRLLLPHFFAAPDFNNSIHAPEADKTTWLGFTSDFMDEAVNVSSAAANATLANLAEFLTKFVQSIQELQCRRDLTQLLLVLSLRSARAVGNLVQIAEELLQEFEAVAADKFVNLALPSSLSSRPFVQGSSSCTEFLWPVTTALILAGLSSLKARMASVEPDFDKHLSILADINSTLILPLKNKKTTSSIPATNSTSLPAPCVSVLILQCIFMIRTPGVDSTVRKEATRVVENIIDRVAKATAVRKKLGDQGQLNEADENLTARDLAARERMEIEWKECSLLFHTIFFPLTTAIRSMLKSPDAVAYRSALEVLSHMVRALGHVKEYLPVIYGHHTSFFCDPNRDVQSWEKNVSGIEQRLHLDLYRILTSENVASNPDRGGDVFNELLHVQRHRRSRGIALLDGGVSQLQRPTLCHVCIPLGLSVLVQTDAVSHQAFHPGLAERGSTLLSHCVRAVPWAVFMNVIRRIAENIRQTPARETLLLQALCKVTASFDYKFAIPKDDSEEIPDNVRQAIEKSFKADAQRRGRSVTALKGEEAANSADLPVSQPQEASKLKVKDDEEDDDDENSSDSHSEGSMLDDSEDYKVVMPIATMSDKRAFDLVGSIRSQLLPLLRKLSTVNQSSSPGLNITQQSKKNMTKAQDRKQAAIVLIRPQVVSMQLHILQFLPQPQFHAELPRLLNTLTTCLSYLHGLLSGSSCVERTKTSSTAIAFNKKYRNIVQTLFEHAALGISRNSSFTTALKLQQSFRLLRLHSSMVHSSFESKLKSCRLASEEDAYFSKFMTAGDALESPATFAVTDVQVNAALAELHVARMKKFVVQPGASVGKSAEQVVKVVHGVDSAARASMIGLAGLRLLSAILWELKKEPTLQPIMRLSKSKNAVPPSDKNAKNRHRKQRQIAALEAGGLTLNETRQIMESVAQLVINCFCDKNEELFQWAAKDLLGLLCFDLPCIEKEWKRISAAVLRILRASGGNVSKSVSDRARGLACTCTKVLALLVTNSTHTDKWFNQMMNSTELAGGSSGAVETHKQKKMAGMSFKTALLSQIRFSIDDARLRVASLQLFRRVILLRERKENLAVPEHAALVYQCADEVGTLLVQRSIDEKLTGLCCSIYVDFLMSYPMTEKAQQLRVAFLIKNLSCATYRGRRAVLAVIFELADQLPPEVLTDRYGSVFLLSLTLRLSKESDQQTQSMTRTVMSRVLSLVADEDKRMNMIRIVIKAFYTKEPEMRSALAEFLDLCTRYYHNSGQLRTKLDLLLPPIWNCILAKSETIISPEWFSSIRRLEVLGSDWKPFYLVCRCVERLMSSLTPREILSLTRTNDAVQNTFMCLWRTVVLQGYLHNNSLVKMSSMRAISGALNMSRDGSTRHSTTSPQDATAAPSEATPDGLRVAELLFSATSLPDLSRLVFKTSERRVTPLVKLLLDLTVWMESSSFETAPAVGRTLVPLICDICRVLIRSKVLVEECDGAVDDDEATEAAEVVRLRVTADEETLRDSIESSREKKKMKSKGRTSNSSPNSNDDDDDDALQQPLIKKKQFVETHVSNDDGMADDDGAEEEEEEKDAGLEFGDDAANAQLKRNEAETAEEADDTEDLLLGQEQSKYSLLQKSFKPTNEEEDDDDHHHGHQDDDGDDNITNFLGAYQFENLNAIKSGLRRTRIAWLVTHMSSIIKRGMGNVGEYRVRLISSIDLLGQLIPILPPTSLSAAGGGLLRSMVYSLSLCLTMGPHSSAHQLKYSDYLQVDLERCLSCLESPQLQDARVMQITALTASLSERVLSQLQRVMARHNLEADFSLMQKNARTALSKRRQKRKVDARLEKVRKPQSAAMKKIRKQVKNKLLHRKKIKMFKSYYGN